MKLSYNFTLEELIESATASRLGINNQPSEKIISNLKALCEKVLQPLRDSFRQPIRITSGYRCQALNKAVSGSNTSQHLKGEAADINIGLSGNRKLFELAQKMVKEGKLEVGQLINERNYSWVHISLPDGKHKNQIIHL